MRTAVVGLLAGALWAAPSQQQPPPPQQPAPVFRARVDLVTVDVAVVSQDGLPVPVDDSDVHGYEIDPCTKDRSRLLRQRWLLR